MSADRPADGVAEVAEELRRHLAWLADAGVRELPPAPERAPGEAPRPAAEPPAPAAAALAAPSPPAGSPEPPPGRAAAGGAYALSDRGCGSDGLLSVRRELGECTRCKLAKGRTKLVFGVGNPSAELVFVGEGPGEDEDRQGEPFVGRAGQLLTKMIEAMGYRRDEVYIANVVKCRPPGNRDPQPDEIEACAPWLDRQLELIKPRVIVTLGNFATKLLLQTKDGITKLRGKEFAFARAGHSAVLIPTLHPSAVLRSGGRALAEARADFVHVKRALT